jgi:hypothetical protein
VLAESGLRVGNSQFGYWLRRCDGFRVDSPAGRVGYVVELRYGSSSEEPDAIVVRAGLFGRVLLIVPAGEIGEIVPRERRVLLLRSPRSTTPGPARSASVPGPRDGRGEVDMVGQFRAMTGRASALIKWLARQVPLIREKGGERAMTPETEAPAEAGPEEPRSEAPVEEPAAEVTQEAAAEEPAAEVTEEAAAEEAEAEVTEEAAVEEAAVEEAPVEESAAEATEEAAAEESSEPTD